jgi:inorganic phosphate transporter, PiT family
MGYLAAVKSVLKNQIKRPTGELLAPIFGAVGPHAAGHNVLGDPRPAVTNYVITRQINEGTYPSLALLIRDIAKQISRAEAVGNTRNDMYLTSEAIRFLQKDKESDLSKAEIATLGAYKKGLGGATKFNPD